MCFFKRVLFKGIKNDIPMCQTRIYTNTNTQIQHITKCQKDPTCGIFLKRGMFKDIKNHIHMCPINKCKKNINIQIEHMTNCQKDPISGIFKKTKIVQGYKNLYSHVSNAQLQKKITNIAH